MTWRAIVVLVFFVVSDDVLKVTYDNLKETMGIFCIITIEGGKREWKLFVLASLKIDVFMV